MKNELKPCNFEPDEIHTLDGVEYVMKAKAEYLINTRTPVVSVEVLKNILGELRVCSSISSLDFKGQAEYVHKAIVDYLEGRN